MAYPTVNITRLANQLSRQGQDAGEGVAALVMGGVAVGGGAALNTVYKLYSVTGAENIGLDAAYDTVNSQFAKLDLAWRRERGELEEGEQ